MKKQWDKEFITLSNRLGGRRSNWEVWNDFLTMAAIAFANVMPTPERTEREDCYLSIIRSYEKEEQEIFPQLLSVVTMAFEENPKQDFLGNLYTALNLNQHQKGQFFTPYHICEFMAEVQNGGDLKAEVEKKGFISVSDPACGAGATLIATANTMKRCKHNFQNHVLFVGQDIDRVTGMMCYIQLSLLGCAGYVCIADTLSNPLTGPALFPTEQKEQELWYTPMFYSDVWALRKLFHSMGAMTGGIRKPAETEPVPKVADKEQFFIFFDFDKEDQNGREQEIRAGI